ACAWSRTWVQLPPPPPFSEQLHLRARRPAKRRRRKFRHPTRYSCPPAGYCEQFCHLLRVDAFATHPLAELRFVELAAAHVPDSSEHLPLSVREVALQPLHEKLRDSQRQTERHHASAARPRLGRGFHNRRQLVISQPGDD